MLLWNYEDQRKELIITVYDQGINHKVVQENIETAKELAFWLKHYQRLTIDDFRIISQIDKANVV